MYFIVTTPVNRQYDGMWEVQWAVGECNVIKTRYKGLFLIEADEQASEKVKSYKTTAIHKVIPLDTMVSAQLPDMSREIVDLAKKKLKKGETFAVRCKRRGFSVSSKEIEQKIGALIVETFGNAVDLETPDRMILIEIIDDRAGIAIIRKSDIIRKEVVEL